MSLADIMTIASTGMAAQSIRLNVAASNIANANTLAGSEKAAYHAREAVFQPIDPAKPDSFSDMLADSLAMGVRVKEIQQNSKPAQVDYQPGSPLADEKGFVYKSNVSTMDEMSNIIEASRDYERNVQIMQTAKKLIEHTLKLAE